MNWCQCEDALVAKIATFEVVDSDIAPYEIPTFITTRPCYVATTIRDDDDDDVVDNGRLYAQVYQRPLVLSMEPDPGNANDLKKAFDVNSREFDPSVRTFDVPVGEMVEYWLLPRGYYSAETGVAATPRRRRGYSMETRSRRRRGCDVDIPRRRGRGDAVAATSIFHGGEIAMTPRLRRGYSAETGSRPRRGYSAETGRGCDVDTLFAATPRPKSEFAQGIPASARIRRTYT